MADGSVALQATSNEGIDLETAPLEEIFDHFECTSKGLSSDEAQERLTRFGYNKLEEKKMASAIYLQVSTISQALIFVTRSRSWSFAERPGYLLLFAFLVAQMIASVISAMADWKFAGIRSIGWGWTGVIWIYNIVTYMLLDPIKFVVRYGLSGKPWTQMFEQRIAFTGRRETLGKNNASLLGLLSRDQCTVSRTHLVNVETAQGISWLMIPKGELNLQK